MKVIETQYSNHYCKILKEQANRKSHLLVNVVANPDFVANKTSSNLFLNFTLNQCKQIVFCSSSRQKHTQLSAEASLATGKRVLTALCCVLSLCVRNHGALFNHKLCFQAPSLLLLCADCVSSPAGPL